MSEYNKLIDVIEGVDGDIAQLGAILERFMVGLLNNLVGVVNTTKDAEAVQALVELQTFLEER